MQSARIIWPLSSKEFRFFTFSGPVQNRVYRPFFQENRHFWNISSRNFFLVGSREMRRRLIMMAKKKFQKTPKIPYENTLQKTWFFWQQCFRAFYGRTMLWENQRRSAALRATPQRSAPLRGAARRCAPLRGAARRFAPRRFAPRRSTALRAAPRRSAPLRGAEKTEKTKSGFRTTPIFGSCPKSRLLIFFSGKNVIFGTFQPGTFFSVGSRKMSRC